MVMLARGLGIFLLLFVVLASAWADATQERRVNISVSIFPRIVAVDQELSSKLDQNGNVNLGVVYVENRDKAESIARKIRKKVSKIGKYKIKVTPVSVTSFDKEQPISYTGLFLVEPANDVLLNALRIYSQNKEIMFFSPFDGDVERGAMAGIFVAAKIRPYFNMNAIKRSNIKLRPAILRVSKIYE